MYTVLIVEDDYDYSEQLSSFFQDKKIKLLQATDGEEGVKQATENLPDLIILDLMLPKKLGVTVLEELRQVPQTKEIPIIVVSSFSSQFNKSNFQRLGVDQFIHKANSTPEQIANQALKILEKSS